MILCDDDDDDDAQDASLIMALRRGVSVLPVATLHRIGNALA